MYVRCISIVDKTKEKNTFFPLLLYFLTLNLATAKKRPQKNCQKTKNNKWPLSLALYAHIVGISYGWSHSLHRKVRHLSYCRTKAKSFCLIPFVTLHCYCCWWSSLCHIFSLYFVRMKLFRQQMIIAIVEIVFGIFFPRSFYLWL